MIRLDSWDGSEVDMGHGVFVRGAVDKDGDIALLTVAFTRPEGRCEGGVSIKPSADNEKYDRPVWTILKRNPLELTPSILCPRHPEEHGWIRHGRWVPA